MEKTKVFVRYEKGKENYVLHVLIIKGYLVNHTDVENDVENNIFIIEIDKSKISEVEKINGVVEVFKDIQFNS